MELSKLCFWDLKSVFSWGLPQLVCVENCFVYNFILRFWGFYWTKDLRFRLNDLSLNESVVKMSGNERYEDKENFQMKLTEIKCNGNICMVNQWQIHGTQWTVM